MVIELTRKKLLVLLALLVVVVAVPLTVYLSGRPQETRSRASVEPDSMVVGTFDGQQITKGDVRRVAEEQYDPAGVDNPALKDALDTLVERKILDKETTSLGISALPEEVDKKSVQSEFSHQDAGYDVLRDKIISTEVKNWKIYTIGFWVPPTDERTELTALEVQTLNKELSDGTKALNEAEISMRTSNDPLAVAKGLTAKYSSIGPILAVNGFILGDTATIEAQDFSAPQVYQLEATNRGQAFFDSLYSMTTPGQVVKVLSEKQSGGSVVKLISANPSAQFDTYDAWLASKKASSFRSLNNL